MDTSVHLFIYNILHNNLCM